MSFPHGIDGLDSAISMVDPFWITLSAYDWQSRVYKCLVKPLLRGEHSHWSKLE